MRLLIYDEAPVGHHPFYVRHAVTAARDSGGHNEILYCFPVDLHIDGVEYIPLPSRRLIRPLRLIDRYAGTAWLTRYKWKHLDRLVRETRIDRVFIMDAEEFLKPQYVPHFQWEWVPLYIHPRALRRPRERLPVEALRTRQCSCVYTLDEGVTDALASACGKPVLHFPDLAENGLDESSPLVAAVKKRAEGRPIICALGGISSHKNVVALLEVAKRNEKWLIVVAGSVLSNRLSHEELAVLRAAASMPNVIFHPEAISDATLNSLTAISSVVYACYIDFPHSSNKLTKACLFRVPVLVATGDYMGEVVHRHGFGVACDPSSLSDIERSIQRVLSNSYDDAFWDDYLRRNEIDFLPYAMAPLFA